MYITLLHRFPLPPTLRQSFIERMDPCLPFLFHISFHFVLKESFLIRVLDLKSTGSASDLHFGRSKQKSLLLSSVVWRSEFYYQILTCRQVFDLGECLSQLASCTAINSISFWKFLNRLQLPGNVLLHNKIRLDRNRDATTQIYDRNTLALGLKSAK